MGSGVWLGMKCLNQGFVPFFTNGFVSLGGEFWQWQSGRRARATMAAGFTGRRLEAAGRVWKNISHLDKQLKKVGLAIGDRWEIPSISGDGGGDLMHGVT